MRGEWLSLVKVNSDIQPVTPWTWVSVHILSLIVTGSTYVG